jgi:Mrp family chromosome partitioning ATPase
MQDFSYRPVTAQPGGTAELAFEQLASTLVNYPQTHQGTAPLKTLAVIGATSGVGTTTVAMNLAHKFARSKESVLVVTVQAEGRTGDSKAASGKFDMTIRPVENFYHSEVSAAHLSQSAFKTEGVFADILRDLEKKFAHVIWDLPPADKAAESKLICQKVQGTLFVLHAGKTRWRSAKHTLDTLQFAGVNVLGVVLNKKKAYIPQAVYRFLFRDDI